MTTIILDTIARHLEALPLDESKRAEIFHAWDVAPDQPVDGSDFDAWEEYYRSEAGRAWRRVREYKLHRVDGQNYYATTLDEMSFHESGPTKTEILTALARAVHSLNGELA
ncbi:hypothetical protein [Streptomyces sp. AC495_CC817]|uniref:hypothetical protein n=1 Tax=Streptomyces sp. AC495_CC817 TaxID=2823900 RepID=UPI001C252C20|nr:hypothetical protein [Streptomyces sp. AC495_CC817]